MSLLSNFVKQIESLKASWMLEKQHLLQFSSLSTWQIGDALPPAETLTQWKLLIDKIQQQFRLKVQDDLMDQSTKLQVKMAAVDPVTGEARYGQAAQSKFQAAQQHLQEIADDITITLAQFEHVAEIIHQKYNALKDKETRETSIEAERRAKEEEAQRQAVLAEEQQRRKEAEEREAAALIELHSKAESIRKQKENESKARLVFEEEVLYYCNK